MIVATLRGARGYGKTLEQKFVARVIERLKLRFTVTQNEAIGGQISLRPAVTTNGFIVDVRYSVGDRQLFDETAGRGYWPRHIDGSCSQTISHDAGESASLGIDLADIVDLDAVHRELAVHFKVCADDAESQGCHEVATGLRG